MSLLKKVKLLPPNELNRIDVAILCGGLGKRLRGEIGESQKVMAKMGQEPFLDILLKDLINQGFKRFILLTGYKAEAVEEYYRTKNFGAPIEFSREKEPLGTGGALKNAKALIQSDPFVCMNGDSFCSLEYKKFLDFYVSKKTAVAIALSKVKDNRDFGTITLDDSKRIISFQEKVKTSAIAGQPTNFKKKAFYVNAGSYYFSKDIFKFMPDAKKFSLESDFFPQLVKENFFGFVTKQIFFDIGTPERLKEAQTILRKKERI